jgi:type VII secretion protein EccE
MKGLPIAVRPPAAATRRGARAAATATPPTGRAGYLGRFHVLRLLAVEAAVAGSLAALVWSSPVVLVGSLAAVVLVAYVVMAQRNGHWWGERVALRWRLARRRRIRMTRGTADPRLAALHQLAPGLTLGDVTTSDGRRIGVACDQNGWFAAARVAPTAAMRDDPGPGLDPAELLRVVDVLDCPGAVVQLVTHTVPAPGVVVDRSSRAFASYRGLLDTTGPVPVDRQTWIAVRLDARALAGAVPDPVRATEHAGTVVATLIRRAARAAGQTGVDCQPLDADGLLLALAYSCGLDRPGAAGRGQQENWHAWQSGGLAHSSFWLRAWPAPDAFGRLLDALANSPAASTSIAITAVAVRDLAQVQCLVRVAAPPKLLRPACTTLRRAARTAGATLSRLDGQHGPAAYSTAPTGGGNR